MKVELDLTDEEVRYIRMLKQSMTDHPINRHKNIPSIVIFMKLAEVVE